MSGNADPHWIDTDGTEYPVCPKCGKSDHEWWDGLGRNAGDGDSWESTCPHCEAAYEVTIFTSYRFTTEAKTA